jgi:hypothetical protein
MLDRVRLTQFQERLREAFGDQAPWVARDHVFLGLGQRTIDEALAAGESAKDVWRVVHEEMRLPARLR